MPNLKKQIGVAVNDLGIYFNGVQVAVGHNNINDVVRYLTNMKAEVDYALNVLKPLEQKVDKTEAIKQDIKNDMAVHRSKVEELKEKLKKLVLYKPSLRTALSKLISSRYVPEIIFKFDKQFEKQQRIEALIESVKGEDQS